MKLASVDGEHAGLEVTPLSEAVDELRQVTPDRPHEGTVVEDLDRDRRPVIEHNLKLVTDGQIVDGVLLRRQEVGREAQACAGIWIATTGWGSGGRCVVASGHR